MMMIVDAVLDQQKKTSEEVKNNEVSGTQTSIDGDFADRVLNNPNQYR